MYISTFFYQCCTGIDIKSDFIVFTRNKSNISYRVFEGFLKDENAFETVAKRIHPGIAVEKDDDFKFLKVDADKLITWSNSKFIFYRVIVVLFLC